jgi:hypothetical protein
MEGRCAAWKRVRESRDFDTPPKPKEEWGDNKGVRTE